MLSIVAAVLMAQGADARLAGAYRQEKAGWIYAHLEGSPANVGYQYGYLLGPEIDDAHKALKGTEVSKEHPWSWMREQSKRIFWPKLDAEYQQEMQGMADGLRARGYTYDVWDVLAFNAHIELDYYVAYLDSRLSGEKVSASRESCSAFVATGSATKDGKAMLAHSLWWGYVMGQRFNAVLDIKPEKGNRIVMDALCGLIHSGSDFAINSQGLMLCETTISGFHGFDPNGIPEFQRMRKAIQYSSSLDDMVRIFKEGNNGGYANTWLMADSKNNEIGKLELGLKNVTFTRSKDGYFVGANFPENPKLIAEETTGFSPDPRENGCMRRKMRFDQLFKENAGKVDAELGKTFLADTYDPITRKTGATGATICGRSDLDWGILHGAINTKVVTSDMVKKLSFWARMGISDGSELIAADFFSKHPGSRGAKPYLRDIKTQPWVVLEPKAP